MTSKENMRKNNRTYYQRHKEEILQRRKAKREDYKTKLAQAKELLKEWAYNYGHVNELLEQKSLSFINKE